MSTINRSRVGKSKVKTSRINRGRWTQQRLRDIAAHLRGTENANGRDTLKFYSQYKFTTSNGRVYATDDEFGKREILTPERATKMIKDSYSKSEVHTGKIPTVYHTLSKKYIGISWPMVEKAIKSTRTYQLHDARQTSKPKGGNAIAVPRVGALLEVDLMQFSG